MIFQSWKNELRFFLKVDASQWPRPNKVMQRRPVCHLAKNPEKGVPASWKGERGGHIGGVLMSGAGVDRGEGRESRVLGGETWGEAGNRRWNGVAMRKCRYWGVSSQPWVFTALRRGPASRAAGQKLNIAALPLPANTPSWSFSNFSWTSYLRLTEWTSEAEVQLSPREHRHLFKQRGGCQVNTFIVHEVTSKGWWREGSRGAISYLFACWFDLSWQGSRAHYQICPAL